MRQHFRPHTRHISAEEGCKYACGSLLLELTEAELQLDSVFKCLEPVSGKDSDEGRNRRPFGNLMLNAKSDWFRVYKVGDRSYPAVYLYSNLLRHSRTLVSLQRHIT